MTGQFGSTLTAVGFFSVAGPTGHSLELCHGFHPRPDHQCRLFQTFA